MVLIALIGMFAVLAIMCATAEFLEWIERRRTEEPIVHIPPKHNKYPEDDWVDIIMKD